MPRKESLYLADWLRIAEKDLQRAEHLLEIHVERYPFVTGTGLTEDEVRSSRGQVQQLIEKIRTATSQPQG